MAIPPGLTGDRLIRELNRQLEEMERKLGLAVLRDKNGDVDIGGRRIKNVAHTKESGDVPSRKELYNKGMYEDPKGVHRANSTIEAPHGIRSLVKAREDKELITLGQAKELLGGSSESANAVLTTNVDQTILGYKQFWGLCLLQVATSAVNGINSTLIVATPNGPIGCFIRVTGPTAAYSIAGFRRHNASGGDGGYNGELFILFNKTNFPLTLLHESTGAAAENRILCPQSSATSTAGMVVRRFGSVMLIYSQLESRWVCASFA